MTFKSDQEFKTSHPVNINVGLAFVRTEILDTLRCLLCEIKQKKFNCGEVVEHNGMTFSFISSSIIWAVMRGRHVAASQARSKWTSRVRNLCENSFLPFPVQLQQKFLWLRRMKRFVGICLITQLPPDLIERLKDIKWFFDASWFHEENRQLEKWSLGEHMARIEAAMKPCRKNFFKIISKVSKTRLVAKRVDSRIELPFCHYI